MRLFSLIIFLFISASLFAQEKPTSSVEQVMRNPLVQGNTEFALHLYSELVGKNGNLFFSPYSVSSALGMTYAGARGSTASELQKALCFPADSSGLNPEFQKLTQKLLANGNAEELRLDIANALCLTSAQINDPFKKILKNYYDAEIFSGDVNIINAWVKSKTHGMIPTILDSLNKNTACVILNAIYFKGVWENPFKKAQTLVAPFHLSETKQNNVPMMYQQESYPLIENREQGFKALLLPYKGNRLSFLLILPDRVDGLPSVEKQVENAASLEKLVNEIQHAPAREVELTLPKFKLESNFDLVPAFMNLGMHEAFGQSANFSGIDGKRDLFISQIQHKAVLEVDEEGSKAAAATAVVMMKASVVMGPPPARFLADHPFLFFILDNRTHSILFMGRMTDPA